MILISHANIDTTRMDIIKIGNQSRKARKREREGERERERENGTKHQTGQMVGAVNGSGWKFEYRDSTSHDGVRCQNA